MIDEQAVVADITGNLETPKTEKHSPISKPGKNFSVCTDLDIKGYPTAPGRLNFSKWLKGR